MPDIIIDTDIGTNADDAIAIALASKSEEISIRGVTTVYGDVDTRSSIAKEILALAGREDIDVYKGIENPLLRKRKVFWAGIEGKGLYPKKEDTKEKKHAVQFIIDTIMQNPGEITLVTIGPLTNIAVSIILEPKIIDHVKEIIMMGGVTRLGSNRLNLELSEHNVNCDPEAAAVVFESGIKITMVGLDVTRQIVFSALDKQKMITSSSPLATTLSSMIDDHMAYMNRSYGYLSDPITVSLLIDDSIVKKEKMDVTIECDSEHKQAYTVGKLSENGNVSVCLEIDQKKFFSLLKERVFG